MPQEWTETAAFEALKDGALNPVFPKGLPVLLIRKGTELFAVENRCAHMGCPLALGRLDGYTLRCPCHDWEFDIRSGRFAAAAEIAIKTYPAELRGGKVFVRLS
jgi:3-phenylpropionate/trans-cinnamate dioxygenase ferredoxin subunit